MYASVISSSATIGGIYVTQNLGSGASSTWTKLSNPPRTQGHPASIVVLNDGKVVCTFSGRRTTSFTNSSGCFLYDPVANTWSDVSDPGMYYWTKDVVIDPSDATQKTWYVCVFSGWGGAPNGLGGLYKTTNRGTSWTKLTGSQFDRVTSITFNPNDNNEAWLTTEVQGLWRSTSMSQATPAWSLVTEYPFRQPERVFYNPYNSNEIWITSFGNGLKKGTTSTTYTVTASSGPNGSINPTGIKTVNSGDSAQYIMAPSVGYHIDSVIVDGVFAGTASPYTFKNITANHTIRAVYAIDKFNITASSGPNGSIAPSGTVSVNYNDSAKFVFTPTGGYHVDSVIVDGAMFGTPASYTFKNVVAGHTIRVVFAVNAPVQFTINASSGPNGSVSPSGVVMVNAGDSSKFVFTPSPGYHVDSVIVDGVMTGAPSNYTFYVVQSNRTIRVVFAANPPNTYAIVSTAGTHGTINPMGVKQVIDGDSAQYLIFASAGYHIDSVIVDNILIPPTPVYTFHNVKTNHNIRVTFAIDKFTITSSTGSNGTITPLGSKSVDYGDSVVYVFTPDAGYHVDSVIVDSVPVGQPGSYTFHLVNANHNIRAVFAQNAANQFTITSSTGPGGTINPLGTITITAGDSAQYIISAIPGYVLDSVLVDSLPITLTNEYVFKNVTASHNIRAAFRPDTFQIVSSAGPNGTINPSGTTNLVAFDSVQCVFTPAVGYFVDSVIVDSVFIGNPTSYTFKQVVADHEIRVVFGAPDTFHIISSAKPNGTISPLGMTNVISGDSLLFTITPNANYLIDSIIVDGVYVGSMSSYVFDSVKADHTILATFRKDYTGIEENTSLSSWSIQPNPAHHSFRINVDLMVYSRVKLSVVNQLGQVVKILSDENLNTGAHSMMFSALDSGLATGIYSILLQTEAETQVKSLIIE